jgi:transposase
MGEHLFAGIDTHKDTLAFAIIDQAGRPRVVEEAPNTVGGFVQLVASLAEHHVVRVGIEGSGNYGRAVALHLAISCPDLTVVEVPTRMTARERSAQPGKGTTDPVDAIAIARITAREQNLPAVRLSVGPAADLRVLLAYRDQLVLERTACTNRIHSDLVGLRPGYQAKISSLAIKWQIAAALALVDGDDSVQADLCGRRLRRVQEIDVEIAAITKQISSLVEESGTSLTNMYGVGPIVAARFLAEIVDVRRYPNRNAFASANGTAPLATSSGRTVRHRLNRGGNRQLNRALYVIAITQIRADTEGRAYYERKRAAGKTSREAIRCLKRRLSDQVFKTMQRDLEPPAQVVDAVGANEARLTAQRQAA